MYGIRLTLAALPFRPRSPASLAYTSQSRERGGNTAREGPRSGRKAHKTRNTPALGLETFFFSIQEHQFSRLDPFGMKARLGLHRRRRYVCVTVARSRFRDQFSPVVNRTSDTKILWFGVFHIRETSFSFALCSCEVMLPRL